MERNGQGPDDEETSDAIDLAKDVIDLLGSDSVSQAQIDADDYNEETETVEEYLRRKQATAR